MVIGLSLLDNPDWLGENCSAHAMKLLWHLIETGCCMVKFIELFDYFHLCKKFTTTLAAYSDRC